MPWPHGSASAGQLSQHDGVDRDNAGSSRLAPMKIGILKTDAVREEWAQEYGEYPDMFMAILGAQDPSLAFTTYDVRHGEYPASLDDEDAYLITGKPAQRVRRPAVDTAAAGISPGAARGAQESRRHLFWSPGGGPGAGRSHGQG